MSVREMYEGSNNYKDKDKDKRQMGVWQENWQGEDE